MKVEQAGPEDLADVMELEQCTEGASHWGEAAYRAAVSGNEGGVRRCLLVARLRDELVGFAAGSLVAGTAELESVVVRSPARRQGVGRALCLAILAWAWDQDAKVVELEVRASSENARALYVGLGFVECGRRPGYYSQPGDDAVLLRVTRLIEREEGGRGL